jgi:hypothetical protein
MPFDTDKFATYLRKHAGKHSQSHCAKFVRLALEAGGANTGGHPTPARLYGPPYSAMAFTPFRSTIPTSSRSNRAMLS